MDTKDSAAIARLLDFSGGAIVVAVIQVALVLYLSPSGLSTHAAVVSILLGTVGIAILLVGLFWHRIAPSENTQFTQKLAAWASTPLTYVIIVFVLWSYFEVLTLSVAIAWKNDSVGLRNDEQSIAKVIDRLVLPRRLTKTQKEQISRFLQQFESHEYSIKRSVEDQEAGGYASDLDEALTKGGWTKDAANPYIFSNDVPVGLSITLMQTTEHAAKNDPRNPNPSILLQEAFGTAGIRVSAGGGSGISIMKDSLVISVGRARKDTFAFDSEVPQ
jgi:hypothetical protein